MAERRMFTKKVTDDDNFMALSSSAQALYLHLSMCADDDGFCNQVSISMFKAHASVQDLQALLEKRYIYQFENGVIVIKHWRMANALRKDRYTPTAFKEELAQLDVKKNGAYTMSQSTIGNAFFLEEDMEEDLSPRKLAYKRSSLPYSFDYKIKNAFHGKECPVCGFKMQKSIDEAGVISDNRLPTIQHNKPISKGGEHELGNISVICHQCNVSIQDEETDELNAQEVVEVWEQISGCNLVADCLPQDSIGKESIEEISLDKVSTGESINYQKIVDMYNEICISLPRVKSLSDARKKSIKARLNKYSLEDIKQAFINAEESDFLKGDNNRNWTADFDWIMKDSNIAKVLDGNYQNRGNNNPQNKQGDVNSYIDMWRNA